MAIKKWQQDILRECFDRGDTPIQASRRALVADQTASRYYEMFRSGTVLPKGPLPMRGKMLRLNQKQMFDVAPFAERYGFRSLNPFIETIIRIIIKDELYAAILGTPQEWKAERKNESITGTK